MHLYIYEDNVEALARHLILLAVLLDDSQEHAVRMQRFLEVFGNIFLREDTVDYLKHLCRELETLLSSMIADDSGNCVGPLKNMLDISMLRYEAKDALLSSIEQARSSTHLDMKSAWDLRCRRWYGDRYDFRRNMVRKVTQLTGLVKFAGKHDICQLCGDRLHVAKCSTGVLAD